MQQQFSFSISAISKYEIYSGANQKQIAFWDDVFQYLDILPFDENIVDTAVQINHELRKKRKQIDIADLFIAVTAMTYQLPMATLNRKHFERIETLIILE